MQPPLLKPSAVKNKTVGKRPQTKSPLPLNELFRLAPTQSLVNKSESWTFASALKSIFQGIFPLVLLLSFASGLWASESHAGREQALGIIAKIAAAYAQIEEYQTETEINEYQINRIVATRRFRYTFKKPNLVRIDMESPYPGMVLVYPDDDNNVALKFGFLHLKLSPDNALLRSSAGQRIDQTDLGLLIKNISRSLTDRRHGDVTMTRQDGHLVMEALAEDHFLAGVLTRYRLTVDEMRWLPMGVDELTADGIPKRTVVFRNLRSASGIPDSFFRMNGGN